MSIDKMSVDLQCLSILRHCLLEFAMLFQEGAIAVAGLSGLWRQTHSGFAFRRRFVCAAELFQKINMTGVVLGVVGVDPERVLEMGLRLLEVPFCHQNGGETRVGLGGIGLK